MRALFFNVLLCASILTCTSHTAYALDPLAGQSIYEQNCVTCHEDGVAGAPRFRHKGDWAPRLQQKNLDELTASAIKGLNAMPAKGTCTECSDADIKAAIEYMVPEHE